MTGEKVKLRKELMRLERLEEILVKNLEAVRNEISIVRKEIEEVEEEKNNLKETKEVEEIFLRETTLFKQKQILNCLNRKGIYTLEQLAVLEEMDLIRISGIGPQSVEYLLTVIKEIEIERIRVLENRRKIQEQNHVLDVDASTVLPSKEFLDKEGIKTLEELYNKTYRTRHMLCSTAREQKIFRYINQYI